MLHTVAMQPRTQGRLGSLDDHLYRRLTDRPAPVIDALVYPLTRSADGGALWLAVAALAAWSPHPAARRAALRGTAALAIASVVANVGVKPLVGRRRPEPTPHPWRSRPPARPRTTSFPSGHSACAAAFAVGASLETAWATPLLALAGAIGYSRIRTGVHYPLDVAAGFTIGTGVALATAHWWPRTDSEPAPMRGYEPPSGGGDQLGT